jgi:acyl-CoA thioester hydrolase
MPDRQPLDMPDGCFDLAVTVAADDIDANGHANNIVYLRWVQEAATAHWFAAVAPPLASSVSWVVVRHKIDYKKPPRLGEGLIVRTWIGDMSGVTSERFCDVFRRSDGLVLAKARTIWCTFNPATGRPARIPLETKSYFAGREGRPEIGGASAPEPSGA